MFNLAALQSLLSAKPFTPFRFHLSDGGTVDVPSRELVMPGKSFAVVGIPDPSLNETVLDRWTTVWFMHVTRVEMLAPGAPPFTAPPPSGTDVPSPMAG
jgi:hypothetical protein